MQAIEEKEEDEDDAVTDTAVAVESVLMCFSLW